MAGDSSDYSFIVYPSIKTRIIAGPYDCEKQIPRYEIEISVPRHVRDQVEVIQILLGNPQSCKLGWDIKNGSIWPASFVAKKDGIPIKIF